MKQINININIEHCQLDELSDNDRELVERALKATENSYAEYSHFYVGAAIRLANGNIMIGANQENAAFPSSLCAERTAIFAAHRQLSRPGYNHTCHRCTQRQRLARRACYSMRGLPPGYSGC